MVISLPSLQHRLWEKYLCSSYIFKISTRTKKLSFQAFFLFSLPSAAPLHRCIFFLPKEAGMSLWHEKGVSVLKQIKRAHQGGITFRIFIFWKIWNARDREGRGGQKRARLRKFRVLLRKKRCQTWNHLGGPLNAWTSWYKNIEGSHSLIKYFNCKCCFLRQSKTYICMCFKFVFCLFVSFAPSLQSVWGRSFKCLNV